MNKNVDESLAKKRDVKNPRVSCVLDGDTAIRLRDYCKKKGLIQNRLVNLIINSYIDYENER